MKKQARRTTPRIRRRTAQQQQQKAALTLGDLVSAAYDTLSDTRQVKAVLGSDPMALQLGRRIIFV